MPNQSVISLSESVLNLSRFVSETTEQDFASGLAWYTTAHSDCLLASIGCEGVSFRDFCKVVAILSPSTPWERNIQAAINLCEQWSNDVGEDNIAATGTRYYANNRKAYKVLAGQIEFVKSGTGKTFSFYQNIFNPSAADFLTVDYWIYRAATGANVSWATWTAGKFPVCKATYQTISDAIREVARQFNIFPLQAQAIAWLAVKTQYSEK